MARLRKPIDAALVPGRLRQLLTDDGRPFSDIAVVAGMNPTQIFQIISGVRPNPTVTTVAKLLSAMGRKWADLD